VFDSHGAVSSPGWMQRHCLREETHMSLRIIHNGRFTNRLSKALSVN
jgi:hypothetical protein